MSSAEKKLLSVIRCDGKKLRGPLERSGPFPFVVMVGLVLVKSVLAATPVHSAMLKSAVTENESAAREAGNIEVTAEEARNEYAEALQLRRGLAQKNPETYLPDVARTLNSLGILDRHQHQIAEARKDFAEARQIYESFASKNPQRFSTDVTMIRKLLAQAPR